MVILQQKVNKDEGEIKSHEYETTKVKFDLDNMLIGYTIECHKQIRTMVSIYLMQATTNIKKFITMATKLEDHLKKKGL